MICSSRHHSWVKERGNMMNGSSEAKGNSLEIKDESDDRYSDNKKLTEKMGTHVTSSLFAIAISRLLTLVLVKILAVLLTKSDFGIYNLWISFVMLLKAIAVSASVATLWRYLQARSYTEEEKSSLLSSNFIASLILCVTGPLLLFMVYILSGYVIAEDTAYFLSLVISTILALSYVLQELVRTISGTEQNSREILVFNAAFSTGSFLGAVGFTIVFGNFRATMLGLFIGLAIPTIIASYYKLRQYGWTRPSRPLLNKSFSYGGPLRVVRSIYFGLPFLASYFVAIYLGYEDVGVLAVTFAIATGIGFVFTAPIDAYNAYLVKTYEADQMEVGDKITSKIIEFFISVSTVTIILVWAFASIAIRMISTEAYLDGVSLLPLTVTAIILLSFSAFWRFRLFLIERPNLVAIAYCISLFVLVISSVTLIPSIGLVGAGIAMILQGLSVTAIVIAFAQRNIAVKFSKSFFGKWILALIVSFLISSVLFSLGFSELITGIIVSGVFLTTMMVTRAHRINDIKRMIRLLVPTSRK